MLFIIIYLFINLSLVCCLLATLQVENLYKDYITRRETYRAIDGVTLNFPANQIIALLGPSGSGKTTLLRMIAGLETVTDGYIFFEGKNRNPMGNKVSHS